MSKNLTNKKQEAGTPNSSLLTPHSENTSLQSQMEQMKSEGYVVLPNTITDGSHDMMAEFGNVLNFSGFQNGVNILSRGGYNAAPSDPIAAAGGITGTAVAIPVPADKNGNEIGTPGKGYIPWGANNNLPNIVALVNSQLVYTALCVKFNIDVLCGLGVEPIFHYHSSVGCNENEDELSYKHAGSYLQTRLLRTRKELFNMLKDYTSVGSEEALPPVTPGAITPNSEEIRIAPPKFSPAQQPDTNDADDSDEENNNTQQLDVDKLHAADGLGYKRYADDVLDDIIRSYNAQISRLEKQYKTWGRTNAKIQQFERDNNQARFAHDVATDLVQFNIAFVEVQLSQDATRQKNAAQWRPVITGLRWRDALSCRKEEYDENGISRYIYVSNQWLDPTHTALQVPGTPESEGQYAIAAIPALDPQAPLADLTAKIRAYRSAAAHAQDALRNYMTEHPDATADEDKQLATLLANAAYYENPANRPTRFILPVEYRTSGRFYYPQPAYWSIYKDIYKYAANIIHDRAIRKQNENMFSYVLYVHQQYLTQLTNQLDAQKTEKEKQAYKQAEINKIKNFLANKQNNGSTLAACTFSGPDGKDHDAFRVERINFANSKQNAEADSTEITDLSSLICFACEVHPDLIGATPGGASSSGGTYQREMLLINQAKKANLQQIMLAPYALLRDFNGLDKNLSHKIKQKTLTTLDASKTGMVEE